MPLFESRRRGKGAPAGRSGSAGAGGCAAEPARRAGCPAGALTRILRQAAQSGKAPAARIFEKKDHLPLRDRKQGVKKGGYP